MGYFCNLWLLVFTHIYIVHIMQLIVQEDTTDVQVILPYTYVELHAHCCCCSLMQQRERFDWREVPLTMKGVW